MTRLPSLILSATLLTVLPSVQPDVQTCVTVDYTLHSATGPITIGSACLSSFEHTGDHMRIETIDFGTTIFKSGFEVWP